MNSRAGKSFGIHQQRGFWLRCFLGATVGSYILSWTMLAVPVYAQIDVRTIHLPRLHGSVTNRIGKPIANAEVELINARGVATIQKTETDPSGMFAINCKHGSYWLHIKGAGFAPHDEHIIVDSRLKTLFHPSWLYVMLGPGACMDQCSWAFTSKRQFDQTVLLNTAHN